MRSSRGIRIGRASEWLAIGAAVGLVLAGCSSDPGPEPSTPPETTAPTEDPTPTPTETVPPETVEPERPDAMDEVSVEGAEAVARYFLELYPYVYATADLSAWTALSHDECIFCRSVVDNVTAQQNAGTHTVGGGIEISSSSAVEVDEGRWFSVTVRFNQMPSSEVNQAGEVVEDFPEAKKYEAGVAVTVVNGAFVIRAVEPKRVDDEDS